MKFKSFNIENLKGINHATLDFTDNRILTLVGLNESGKTTVLEGIKLFDRLAKGEFLSPKDHNIIRPKGIGFTGSITIKATLIFEEEDITNMRRFAKTKGRRSRLRFPEEYGLKFQFNYKLHKFIDKETLITFAAKSDAAKGLLYESNNDFWDELTTYINSSIVPDVLYYEDFIFQIPEDITFAFKPEIATAESKDNEEWKLVLSDILKSISPEFYSFEQDVVKLWLTDNDTARQRVSAMESRLDSVITSAWQELFHSQENTSNSRRLNFKEIKMITEPKNDGLKISFKVKAESGKEFSINERSKGFKWFFSFLIFTEFRKNRTKNILFLLDEPASNLHSSAQSKIIDAIEELSDKSMIVYSTHSQHLINPLWLKGAYVVINEAISNANLQGQLTDTDAKITVQKYFDFVSKSASKSQNFFFQPILDRLDYKPSQIEITPPVCVCEGKNDWYTFKYISEILLNDNFNYNFYPGAGRDSHWSIIRLYLSWGADFILLLDGDSPGQNSKANYLREFPDFLDSKIFTLLDVVELPVATEGLFSLTDIMKICDTAFGDGTYDSFKEKPKELKSKLNYGILQLLTTKTKIKLEDETIKKFSKIFNFIREGRIT